MPKYPKIIMTLYPVIMATIIWVNYIDCNQEVPIKTSTR
jgi:hypothetical protein